MARQNTDTERSTILSWREPGPPFAFKGELTDRAITAGAHHQEEPVPHPQPLTPEEELADAKKRLNLPLIVAICGSTRFMTEMAEADLRETEAGKIVVKPGCDMKSPHELRSDPVEAEALKVRLDDLHRAKIRLADEVLVVGDYVGDSTRAEIAYARSLGKPVRFTHPEVDPEVDPDA
ncbi:hypothetical protein KNE206_61190 [Kitasatospora sp. NE20-6]